MKNESPLTVNAALAAPQVDRARRRLITALPGLGVVAAGASLLGGCASAPQAARSAKERSSVVPFSQQRAGQDMPPGWAPYIIRPGLARTAYSVEQVEGRTVLHADADSACSGMHCAVNIDPVATPWLRWQWRVSQVHAKATVIDADLEDTPARVIVAFAGDVSRLPLRDRMFFEQVELFTGNHLPFATLTYVWDGQLPTGRVVPYARTPRIQYEVVESGSRQMGRWLMYERNVVQDFQNVFGHMPPGPITSVGVLTDSDDLKNHVEAWYGDIGLFASPMDGVSSSNQQSGGIPVG
jgi:hypothetical protein